MLRTLALIALLAAPFWMATAAQATDFRIVSEVFLKGRGENQVVSKNVTLFRSGLVYDYLTHPDSVTIFDPRRGRFVLLDPEHRVQTELGTRQVQDFNERLRKQAESQKDSLLQFLANPKFKTIPSRPNELILSAANMTYRINTAPAKDAPALRQYLEFSDWYARLNALVNPGSPPPFSRMVINQELKQRESIPTDVELTIVPPIKGAREVKLNSHHEVDWKLLGEDLRRIDETGKQLATFKKISFDDFQRLGMPEPPQDASAAKKPGVTKVR